MLVQALCNIKVLTDNKKCYRNISCSKYFWLNFHKRGRGRGGCALSFAYQVTGIDTISISCPSLGLPQ